MQPSPETKAICFRCRYIDVGVSVGSVACRCPHCGYPLIVNSAEVALGNDELDGLFRMYSGQYIDRSGGLPGVTAPSRKRRLTRKVDIVPEAGTDLPRSVRPAARSEIRIPAESTGRSAPLRLRLSRA